MSTDDYSFASTDAGASDTYPSEAGQIRKGGFIMIKGQPCKVRTLDFAENISVDVFIHKNRLSTFQLRKPANMGMQNATLRR